MLFFDTLFILTMGGQDMDIWCIEVEKTLASEDCGRDLTSVKNLLKKHQLLEVDVAGHKVRIKICGVIFFLIFEGFFVRIESTSWQHKQRNLSAKATFRLLKSRHGKKLLLLAMWHWPLLLQPGDSAWRTRNSCSSFIVTLRTKTPGSAKKNQRLVVFVFAAVVI
jgi:hypothetical protein